MNYLVTIWDAGGSVPPELALVRRLVAAGHQVVALAGPPLQPAVEAAGATFRSWQRVPHRRHPSEPEPFDDSDLSGPPQIVQMFGFSIGPGVGKQLPCTPVGRGQSVGDDIEIDRLERPALERQRCVVKIPRQAVPHGLGERLCFGGVAPLGQPRADRFHRSRRKRQLGFAQIRQGIEGGLSIARTGDPAHQLACLAAHLVGLLAQRLAQQAKQCAPSLERLPYLMDCLGSRKLGVG